MGTKTVIDQAADAIAALDLDYQKRRDALTAMIKQVEDTIAENAQLAVAQEEDAERVAARAAAQTALALALQNTMLAPAEKLMDEIVLWRQTIRLAYQQLQQSPGKQRELIAAATTLAHSIGALAAAYPLAFANAKERQVWITQQIATYCPARDDVTAGADDMPAAVRTAIGLRAYGIRYDEQIGGAAMNAAR